MIIKSDAEHCCCCHGLGVLLSGAAGWASVLTLAGVLDVCAVLWVPMFDCGSVVTCHGLAGGMVGGVVRRCLWLIVDVVKGERL